MNFLSHYFFDSREGNPHYNSGLVIPDLIKSFLPLRDTKPYFQLGQESPINEVLLGCERHIQRDKFFHNSNFFNQYNAFIFEELNKAGFIQTNIRLFFVSHVLYELLLDKLILNTYPNTIVNFYKDLISLQESHLNTFSLHLIPEKSNDFQHFYGKFTHSKFLYHYNNHQGIFESLNRLLNRTKQDKFMNNKYPNFEEVCYKVEERMFLDTQAIFSEQQNNIFA